MVLSPEVDFCSSERFWICFHISFFFTKGGLDCDLAVSVHIHWDALHMYSGTMESPYNTIHDDAIKWKHFLRYWPFVRGIHWSPVVPPPNGQWRRALMFSLICAWTNVWANKWDAGDLRRHHTHYDVTVMFLWHGIIYNMISAGYRPSIH